MNHPMQTPAIPTSLAALAAAIALGAAPVPPAFVRDPTGAATDGQTISTPAAPRVQRIAILPDRTTGRDWGLPYLRAATEDLGIVRPDAVFTVGDMVQGYTRNPAEWSRQADEYRRIVGTIAAPFFPTPGNHDVISGSRAAGDDTFAKLYRATFGPLWYAAELDLATAVVMFSDEGLGDGNIRVSDAQVEWLAGALRRAAARGKPVIVLMHRPLWRYRSVGWDTRVQPLLKAAGKVAVIAGHFHAMQRDADVDGVQYHIVGTCGGMIDQPPLAGQLQHLTFVDCGEDGALRVWHQPVGMVLPEDFIARVDQDRVLALREPRPAVRFDGLLPDPAAPGAPARATTQLRVANPTDVPLRITLDPPGLLRDAAGHRLWWTAGSAGRGTPGTAGGTNGWTSRVLDDIQWDATMANGARAGATVAAIDATVPPKGEIAVPVDVALARPEPGAPAPQVDLYAVFRDSNGRDVPVYLPTRLPIDRAALTATDAAAAPALPVLAWEYSPYDTREANPTVRLALGARSLTADVEVPDAVAAGAPAWQAPDAKRLKDPHADAVRITLRTPAGAATWLAEPFTPGFEPMPGMRIDMVERRGPAWRLRCTVDWPGGTVPDDLSGIAVQVGVADNDETYHTQWRWLAPGGADGGARMARSSPGTTP